MNRRTLLSLLGGAAAVRPFAAAAQPALPIIGYLAETETPGRTEFLRGLEQAGFVVGRNVAIEYRFAEGHHDRLPSLAAELVRFPVAVLVASGAGSSVAAKEATSTIPIVFGSGPDPVQLGIVASLGRPGGNGGCTSSRPRLGRSAWNCCVRFCPTPD